MATYTELYDLGSNSILINKIAVAIAVKAQVFIDGATPSADELTWADKAIRSPRSIAGEVLHYVLAANKALTVAQITGATDAAIQSNVDAAVDKLVAGGVV